MKEEEILQIINTEEEILNKIKNREEIKIYEKNIISMMELTHYAIRKCKNMNKKEIEKKLKKVEKIREEIWKEINKRNKRKKVKK